MIFDDFVDNGQSQAGPVSFCGKIGVEDAGQIFRSNAFSCVSDMKEKLVLL